ncbi:hypothetical protein CC2G_013124 [Coprinopsis cinerea AmutBmut pab1-1]|nr:hypothetical protein CC2G_013124 [Coprinopsis cinerea AmutBmut pab1-1]
MRPGLHKDRKMRKVTVTQGLIWSVVATRVGKATYYDIQGSGRPTFCGRYVHNHEFAVAVSPGVMNKPGGVGCYQWIGITNPANGKRACARVMDTCHRCGTNDLDLTPGLFSSLGSIEQGVIWGVQWHDRCS